MFKFKEADSSVLIGPKLIEDADIEINNQLTECHVKIEPEVLIHSTDTDETESKIFFTRLKKWILYMIRFKSFVVLLL